VKHDFNLTIYDEIEFIANHERLDDLNILFELFQVHLVLYFIKEHGEVFKIVWFKVLNLLEQFNFELFTLVDVVDCFAFDSVEEALLTLEIKLLLNLGKSAVVGTNDRCSSLTIENQGNFSEVITLVQKLR